MKKMHLVLASALVALSFTTLVTAAEEKAVVETYTLHSKGEKPSVHKERTTHKTATVEAIDLQTRVVTLKGSEGNLFDITAGKEVKNLPQVKVGDLVNVSFYESIAVKVFKPGEIPQGMEGGKVAAERIAKPGEKPAGMAGAQVTMTATVESINPNKTSVTLKMSDGKYKVVKVENKKNLDTVNVGDEVMITATEALAIAVKPAKKK